ncbi:restriction endonuclease subunit S [Providencia sp. PROV255]|uniref:restriction endonuclease subunit S n=1 Tax=Providencia sp. PROV255 TaxID=2949943 RepID=UPI002349F0EE|nr:restriction endonuclease subunit S [Providencia sp. PROV255]
MSNGVSETGLNLIPAGYKQTEVGVIPEDWEVKQLKDIFTLKNGFSFKSEFFSNKGPIVLTPGNFKLEGGLYFETRNTKRYVANYPKGYEFKKGDLVVVMTDLTPDCNLLGKPAFIELEEQVLHNQRIGKITQLAKNWESRFLYYTLLSSVYLSKIKNAATGSTVRHTSPGTIASSWVPEPQKKEQTAIATALSDVDLLVSELEKLIAKKRDIKTATMQQLLTGRTRLPQFALREDGSKKGTKQSELGEIPEDWKVKMVFELADCQKSLFDDGDWIEAEHITNKGIRLIQTGNIGVGRYVDKDTKKYIFKESFEKLKCKELHEGDLLICRLAEPAGRACIFPYIGEDKVITSVDVTIFRPSHEVTSREFYNQYFSSSDWFKSVLEQVGGTTHKRISRGALGRISVRYPNIEEQTAIATMLSDMDKEIQALEQRLNKTLQIKQGMMQELLTGKTRLMQGENG